MQVKQAREERPMGTRLTELRKRAGLSQQNLADNMNVSRQSISLWESGNGMPSIDNLLFLSDYYSVSVDYLLGRSDEPSQIQAPSPAEEEAAEQSQRRRKKHRLSVTLGVLLALIVLISALIVYRYLADRPIEVIPLDRIPERTDILPPENGS